MRITPEIKTKINELYLELRNYSAVARQIGCSAGTVKRHIIPNYTSIEKDTSNWIRFKIEDLPIEFNDEVFISTYNLGEFCILTDYEKEELEVLWSEMNI